MIRGGSEEEFVLRVVGIRNMLTDWVVEVGTPTIFKKYLDGHLNGQCIDGYRLVKWGRLERVSLCCVFLGQQESCQVKVVLFSGLCMLKPQTYTFLTLSAFKGRIYFFFDNGILTLFLYLANLINVYIYILTHLFIIEKSVKEP